MTAIHICKKIHTGLETQNHIMAYGSTPYAGMAPKKNGGHIQSESH